MKPADTASVCAIDIDALKRRAILDNLAGFNAHRVTSADLAALIRVVEAAKVAAETLRDSMHAMWCTCAMTEISAPVHEHAKDCPFARLRHVVATEVVP